MAQGKYGQYVSYEEKRLSCMEVILYFLSALSVLVLWPIYICTRRKTVTHYERAIYLRFGRVRCDVVRLNGNKVRDPILGPGIYLLMPYIDSLIKLDIRIQQIRLNEDVELVSLDGLAANYTVALTVRVLQADSALLNANDCKQTTKKLAMAAISRVISEVTLEEALHKRELVQNKIMRLLHETEEYGIQVERIQIHEVRVGEVVAKMLAAEANSRLNTKQSAIRQKEDALEAQLASKHEKETYKDGSTDQLVQRLRFYDCLFDMASKVGTKSIVFPLPVQSC